MSISIQWRFFVGARDSEAPIDRHMSTGSNAAPYRGPIQHGLNQFLFQSESVFFRDPAAPNLVAVPVATPFLIVREKNLLQGIRFFREPLGHSSYAFTLCTRQVSSATNSKATKLLSASDINHSSFFLFFALGNLICLTALVEGGPFEHPPTDFSYTRQNGIFRRWESFSSFLVDDVLVLNYVFKFCFWKKYNIFSYLYSNRCSFCDVPNLFCVRSY